MTQRSPAPMRSRLLATAVASALLILTPIGVRHADAEPANFVFVPPASSPVFPDMAIAIIRPVIDGDLAAAARGDHARHRLLGQFSRAAAIDLAKIITAKGFHTSGSYASLDKLADRDKQRASLLLDPHFYLNMKLAQNTATMTGSVDLTYIEPDTGEKMWIEHIALAPFVRPALTTQDGAALRHLVGAYYPVMMRQIWDQLDPLNIRMLAVKLVGD